MGEREKENVCVADRLRVKKQFKGIEYWWRGERVPSRIRFLRQAKEKEEDEEEPQ